MKGMYRMAFALALLVGLAACSSSDSGVKRERDEAREQAQDLQEQLDTANASIDELRTQLAAATDPETIKMLEARVKELEDAEKAREMAEQAKKDAEAAKDARLLYLALDGTALAFDTDNPIATATSLMGTITGASEATTLKKTGTAVPSLGSWMGAEYMLSETNGPTDTGVVYTNRAAAKRVDIEDILTGITISDDNEIDNAVLSDAANADHVASPTFDVTSGAKSLKLPKAVSGQTQVTMSWSGTFAGAPGNYSCSGTAEQVCTATVSGDGFVLGGGTWSFKFSEEKPMGLQPDPDYLAFGWWLRKSDSGFSVATFTDTVGTGTSVTAPTDVTALQGTATYRGHAAGKYALYGGDGPQPNGGHFTASAMLEADFGNASETGTISGTLNNFMAGSMSTDWTVALKESTITATGAIGGTGIMTEWTIGTTKEDAAGTWAGQMYGVIPAGQDGAGTPGSATGTFSAEYGALGHMVGAFGAERQ